MSRGFSFGGLPYILMTEFEQRSGRAACDASSSSSSSTRAWPTHPKAQPSEGTERPALLVHRNQLPFSLCRKPLRVMRLVDALPRVNETLFLRLPGREPKLGPQGGSQRFDKNPLAHTHECFGFDDVIEFKPGRGISPDALSHPVRTL
jgi:hypothetical protein